MTVFVGFLCLVVAWLSSAPAFADYNHCLEMAHRAPDRISGLTRKDLRVSENKDFGFMVLYGSRSKGNLSAQFFDLGETRLPDDPVTGLWASHLKRTERLTAASEITATSTDGPYKYQTVDGEGFFVLINGTRQGKSLLHLAALHRRGHCMVAIDFYSPLSATYARKNLMRVLSGIHD